MATKDFTDLLSVTWAFTETGDTDAKTMALNLIKPDAEGKLNFSFQELIGT